MGTIPFLSILTPTYKRPKMLEVCRQSIENLADGDYQHLVMVDETGIGVGGQYMQYKHVSHHLIGEYIMVLCDDDMLIDCDMIADLKDIVSECSPDVIMVKWQYGDRVLPDGGVWENAPREGHIGLSNWIVRGDLWRAMAHAYGNRYAGDFDFIASIWAGVKDRIYWHDKIVVATQNGRGYGEPEDA